MENIDDKNKQGWGRTGFPNHFRDSVRHETVKDKFTEYANHYRILYAEDDDSCFMVSVMCGFSDIEVVASRTVAEAWRLAQSEQFDLYLSDSRFADGDGLKLCRRLRSFAPHTPIPIYSGCAFEADRKNGLAAGATDYLIKPYSDAPTAAIRQTIKRTEKTARQTGDDKSANTEVCQKTTNTSIRFTKDTKFYA